MSKSTRVAQAVPVQDRRDGVRVAERRAKRKSTKRRSREREIYREPIPLMPSSQVQMHRANTLYYAPGPPVTGREGVSLWSVPYLERERERHLDNLQGSEEECIGMETEAKKCAMERDEAWDTWMAAIDAT
ncbi:hypothetical protein KIPB_004772 [Kipferlia bialata]|uniref:Uncharacterized protein n=1 Tax=Kipferlia bialata TaxID=797122 RepID=A0A391P263_9EUKA|nr:hypothetical protein KIPB_004772 [Kipferlia bialata]|eukprot:g4772.t1